MKAKMGIAVMLPGWASAVFLMLGLGASPEGQEIIQSYPEVFHPGGFGAFDSIGDIDGDAFPDLVAGDTNNDIPMTGFVKVLSGRTGQSLFYYAGSDPLDRLGSSVAGIGDMSGDGVPDFMAMELNAVAHPVEHIWSGADGRLIADLGPFGVIDALGDINGDGVLDFVQAYYVFLGLGKATVYLGGSFEEVYAIVSPPSSVNFGWSIATIGDVDADKVADFAVGAPGDPIDTICVPGDMYVYSGKDGHLLYGLKGEGRKSLFGARLAGPGDLDGDGIGDIAVAARDCCGVLCDYGGPGRIYFFEGSKGAVLGTFDGAYFGPFTVDLGYGLIAVGDLDGNGYGDVLASYSFGPTRLSHTRFLVAIDGGTRKVIYAFVNPHGRTCAGWGSEPSAAGDANGDDFPDFLAAAAGCYGSPTNRIDLVSGAPRGVHVLGETCGPILPAGRPRIGATGVPQPGRDFPIHLSRVDPGTRAMLLLGQLFPGSDPLRVAVPIDGAGCKVLVRPFKVHLADADKVRPGEGVATWPVMIPNDPTVIGTRFYAQWLVRRDRGWEATRALEVEIQEPDVYRQQ